MVAIAHYVGLGRNYGDMALAYCMHKLFSEVYNQSFVIPYDLKRNSVLTPQVVSAINRQSHMLVVGGGGLLMPGDGFDTASGWQFNISEESLDQLKVPLVCYAVGYNEFPHNTNKMTKEAWDHVRKTIDKSVSFTVRDKATQQKILDNCDREVELMPDPALVAPQHNLPSANDILGVDEDATVIGLSLAGDRMDQRFADVGSVPTFLTKLINELISLLDSDPRMVLVGIPHVSRYDLGVTTDVCASVAEAVGKHRVIDLPLHAPWMYPENYFSVPSLYAVYKRCDTVIGMRGHSNLIPYAVGTPFVALGEHVKNDSFAREVGCPTVPNSLEGLLTSVTSMLSRNHFFVRRHRATLNEMRWRTTMFLQSLQGHMYDEQLPDVGA